MKMSFDDWSTFQVGEDYANGMRVGQSYMNRVRPTEINPELFYETSSSRAWDLIMKLEV